MSDLSSTGRPLGNKLEASLVPFVGFVAAIGLWFLGAFCAGRFLIVFPPAQEVFIGALATLGWSGTTIYLMVGMLLALISLIQLVGWPRSAVQQWIGQRFGSGLAGALFIGWAVCSLLEIAALAIGFERLAAGTYITILVSMGLPPVSQGMLVLSVIVATVLALVPEWLLSRAVAHLVAIWLRI
ncbi:hypothetical protein HC891_19355 [Candidatus Gracilibacteria bacterium]|nr:hypothetical protein [Candidatus Gracilibacteria bacterium]